ncbi:unnamed protein product [Sphagnum troendelagicum]|uniref:Uncharacterized protein n=1 Tax=Sphagnum troendelagicum TaxID=128251 RepID=A0ABP0TDA5_9BRYO
MLFGLGPPPQSRQQKQIPLLILHWIRVSERVDALLHAMHGAHCSREANRNQPQQHLDLPAHELPHFLCSSLADAKGAAS